MLVDEFLGKVVTYDNGQAEVAFVWSRYGGGFAWSIKRQQELAKYDTREATENAFRASQNETGPYGCSELKLFEEEE